jgi:hypothetical protein
VRTYFLGQFLDILQTKGDNGVQKYIDVNIGKHEIWWIRLQTLMKLVGQAKYPSI